MNHTCVFVKQEDYLSSVKSVVCVPNPSVHTLHIYALT